ncbi:MAG TPA: hypothetical protein PLL78_03325 [Fimbriimonadaceae bacterium]|nr:hypothetical protein [Fimbriimonadaceae bacterium]HRJ95691.1 hypothetical protein [Fimbriimonadaceae bacterium]
MSAAPAADRTGFLSKIAFPTREAIYRYLIIFTIPFMIVITLFPSHLTSRIPWAPPPAFLLSIGVVYVAYLFAGPRVLGRTALDWVFLLWFLLSLTSYFSMAYDLNRIIRENDFINFSLFLFPAWAVYRALYAMTIMHPKVAINTLLVSLGAILLGTAVLGILQSQGPLRVWATEFAYNYGMGSTNILEGASDIVDRPTAVFGGPNIFGFVNTIGAAVCCGTALAMGKRLKEWQALVSLAALAVFAYANVNSQTRSAVFLISLLGLAVMTLIVRTGKVRVMVIAGLAFVLVVLGMVATARTGNYGYLTSIFETGLANDESYRIRAASAERVAILAPDIAKIGAGQDQWAQSLNTNYDYFAQGNNAADNAFVFAFFVLGVPGVIHMILLHAVALWMVLRLKVDEQGFLARLKYCAVLIISLFVIVTPVAIRHAKLETFIFFVMILGPVGAILNVQRQMERRKALEAAEAA